MMASHHKLSEHPKDLQRWYVDVKSGPTTIQAEGIYYQYTEGRGASALPTEEIPTGAAIITDSEYQVWEARLTAASAPRADP